MSQAQKSTHPTFTALLTTREAGMSAQLCPHGDEERRWMNIPHLRYNKIFTFYISSVLPEFSKWACITFICRKYWRKFLFYRVIVSFFKRKDFRGERERERNRESQPKRRQGLWVMQSQYSSVAGSYSRGQVASLPGCSSVQPQSTSTWRMAWFQPSNSSFCFDILDL